MNLVTDKYGNIRGWVVIVSLILVTVLSVFGVNAILTLGGEIISSIKIEDRVPEKIINIESKKREEDGLSCVHISLFASCGKTYKYFVNGKKVYKDFYESVREGGTYACKVGSFDYDYLYDCRPKVQGGDENE